MSKNWNKKHKPVVAQIIPEPKDIRYDLLALINTEVHRLTRRQRATADDTGLSGAKQINELVKAVGNLDDQQMKAAARDAVGQMSDNERLLAFKQIILDLPTDEQQQLAQLLLTTGDAKENE